MMTKKAYGVRLFSLLLGVFLLLGSCVLVTGATLEDYVPLEWEMDEDLKYIYGGDTRYDRYYVGGAFYGDALRPFYFANQVLYKGEYCQVYGDSADPHIVSVLTEPGYATIFTDARGKVILDDFLAGIDCIYYLENWGATKLDEELVKGLRATYYDADTALKQVKVSELGEAEIYEIAAYDSTLTKAYQHGAVYLMDDENYYYVCFDKLDNSYFDADGYFSYRSGSVKAYELTKKERLEINGAIAYMAPKDYNYIYEEDVMAGYCDIYGNPIDNGFDPYGDPNYRRGAVTVFLVLTVVIGMILPMIVLILGVVLANSKKTGKAKCWYSLCACAMLWLLAAGFFLLLVLL